MNKFLELISGAASGEPASTPGARFLFACVVWALGLPLVVMAMAILFDVIP